MLHRVELDGVAVGHNGLSKRRPPCQPHKDDDQEALHWTNSLPLTGSEAGASLLLSFLKNRFLGAQLRLRGCYVDLKRLNHRAIEVALFVRLDDTIPLVRKCASSCV